MTDLFQFSFPHISPVTPASWYRIDRFSGLVRILLPSFKNTDLNLKMIFLNFAWNCIISRMSMQFVYVFEIEIPKLSFWREIVLQLLYCYSHLFRRLVVFSFFWKADNTSVPKMFFLRKNTFLKHPVRKICYA